MPRTLVWRHSIPWMNAAQDDLLERLGLDDAIRLIPPGEQEIDGLMSWYAPRVPSRAWCKTSMLLRLGVAESELYCEATDTPHPTPPFEVTADSIMEYHVQQLQKRNIQYGLIWNGWQLVPRSLQAAFKYLRRRYLFVERGFLPYTLCVDPRGVMTESSLTPGYWEKLVSLGLTATQRERVEAAVNKACEGSTAMWAEGAPEDTDTRKFIEALPDRPTVLVIGQLDWDSNVLQRSPQFPTNRRMFHTIEKLATDVNLVYKAHPKDPTPYAAVLPAYNAWGLNTTTLLRHADVVVTRTSTVGAEAIIWRRPVVVLGEALYGERGITLDVRAREDAAATITRAVSLARADKYWTAQREQLRWVFLHWLLFEHLFFSSCRELVDGMSDSMVGMLRRYLTA